MKYIHYKGGEYELLGIGRDEATLTPVAIYKSCATGELWVRTEEEFFGRVKMPPHTVQEPTTVRRFRPAPPEPK